MADAYDRFRPSYPEALFEAIFSFAGLRPGIAADPQHPELAAAICESGAGTGKATMVVAPAAAASGWSLTCVEPDQAMAAVLERKLANVAGLSWSVEVSGFEGFAEQRGDGGAAERFSLLFAAQAWHWVSPDSRASDAAALLRDGGTLALVWNVARPHPPSLQAALDRAYGGIFAPRGQQSAGSGSAVLPPSSPQPLQVGLTSASRRQYDDELERSGLFEPSAGESVAWSSRHTTQEWLSVLRTHSDHRMLDPEVLESLLERVGSAIDGLGGTVEVEYDAVAILARRRARTSSSG